jgi:hypothetical protein
LFFAGLSILSLGLPGNSAAQARQSQAAFETAIRDKSTSPYVVLVTVVDDRTGQVSAGCNSAQRLLSAIQLDEWGSVDGVKLAEAKDCAGEHVSRIPFFQRSHARNHPPIPLPGRMCGNRAGHTRADK